MGISAWFLLLACVTAPLCWWAAWHGRRWWMAVSKPLPMIALLAIALSLPWQGSRSVLVVAALVCGLLGDLVLLDPPSGRPARPEQLPLGLGAFLVGHVAYGAAILLGPMAGPPFPWPVVAVVPVALMVAWRWGWPVIRAAGALRFAVGVYEVVIVSLAIVASVSGGWLVLIGAALFVTSDLLLGRALFISPRRWSPTAVMATYHLAQGLLVAGLLSQAG